MPAKKAPNRAAFLTGKSGLKPPTTIAAMKVDLRDSEPSESQPSHADQPVATTQDSDVRKSASRLSTTAPDPEDAKRLAMTKMVSELPADSEVDLNKKEMIRKMKRDRKKGNLMAMLKTVKRRKDEDLVAEATSELLVIDKQVESQSVQLSEDLLDDQIRSAEKPRPKLELPLPRRFNPEKLRDWDLEFEQAVPSFTFEASESSVVRSTHKHSANMFLQA